MMSFWSGFVVGAGFCLAVCLLMALVIIPSHESSGRVFRAGYGALRSAQENEEGSSVMDGGKRRIARWHARSSKVQNIVAHASPSLIGGIKFADWATHMGFWIGINLTWFGFFVARKTFVLVDTLLAKVHASGYCSGLVERLLVFFHFVDEAVYYAELVTLFALRCSKLVIHVVLCGVLHVLQLHQFMSPKGVLAATASSISSICFDLSTLEAIAQITAMVSSEIGPVAEALKVHDLARAVRELGQFSSQELDAAASIRPMATPLEELDCSADISRWVMFAVGTYGQMGLKFLGIIPYGSVASDTQALAYCAGLESTADILVSDFQGALYLPGYVVCLDRERKAIVVAVRGSIQPWDFLSDLVCEPEPVSLLGVRGFAHRGMLKSAKMLDQKLRSTVQDLLHQPANQGFKVVLCGHSLGAGCSSLLAALWLSDPDQLHPELKNRLQVFGFGTPAVLSSDISMALASTVTSVVLGNDMVPRFSLNSFQRFQSRVIRLHQQGGPVDGDWYHASTQTALPQLLPPGTLVWVDDSGFGQQEPISCVWSEDGLLAKRWFQDLILSDDMFSAHLPQHYAMLGDVPLPHDFF